MIILKETDSRHLVEMAKMKAMDVPPSVSSRAARMVVDQWWGDRLEIGDIYKVGLRYTMSFDIKNRQFVDFDYGFIRDYKNVHQGKSTGTQNNPKFVFKALHIISNIPGITGQWYRDNFTDDAFEKIVEVEDKLNFAVEDIKKFLTDFQMKPTGNSPNMNILSILDRILK